LPARKICSRRDRREVLSAAHKLAFSVENSFFVLRRLGLDRGLLNPTTSI